MSQQVNGWWWRWLVVVTAGTLLFGLGFIVVPGLMQTFFNTLLFGSATYPSGFSDDAVRYILFTYGVLGAVMVGWMVAFVFVLFGAFRRGERIGWNTLAISMLVWYAIDTPFSIASGFTANALFNTAFLIAFAIPLAATYRHFYPAHSPRRVEQGKGV